MRMNERSQVYCNSSPNCSSSNQRRRTFETIRMNVLIAAQALSPQMTCCFSYALPIQASIAAVKKLRWGECRASIREARSSHAAMTTGRMQSCAPAQWWHCDICQRHQETGIETTCGNNTNSLPSRKAMNKHRAALTVVIDETEACRKVRVPESGYFTT